jgi:type VI secretion system protein VasG
VQILDEALEAAVKLSHRYIPARQLPDKAVSLLDTACARVAVSLHATPAEVDDSRKRISALETEHEIITREKDIGIDVGEREAAGRRRAGRRKAAAAGARARWEQEKTLVDELLALRARLRGSSFAGGRGSGWRDRSGGRGRRRGDRRDGCGRSASG